jgi:hypothetical protein
MSIGMLLISIELLLMLLRAALRQPRLRLPVLHRLRDRRVAGRLGLRIAGGIFTKIADIGSDLMKIVFNIKEDDARNPGVIADCTGDNAGDSVGPTADGFETYGVTGVALISFILLAVPDETTKVQLIVWLFAMRIMMVIASGLSYLVNEALAKARYGNADKMDFEAPLTFLVWLTSLVSVAITYAASYLLIPTWATARCGGSSRRSSRAARWPARSSPKSSRCSRRRSPATCAKSSRPRRRRGVAEHPGRVHGRATSAPTGWAVVIAGSWVRPYWCQLELPHRHFERADARSGVFAFGLSRSASSAWVRSRSRSTRTVR